MDVHSPETRSKNMSRIRGRDTKPELIVRKIVHRMGYRYRLHKPELPGKPDIALVRLGKIIEVRGCFWHLHQCPKGQKFPAERKSFWQLKRENTVKRDERNLRELKRAGWKVLIVWECETKKPAGLQKRIDRFLTK